MGDSDRPPAGRVLLAANRLPVTVSRADERFVVRPSVGGLATSLTCVHRQPDTHWVGWPGVWIDPDTPERAAIEDELTDARMRPVWLERGDLAGFYDRIANGVLWPLFHYLPERVPMHITDWAAYERVNALFAAAIAREYGPDDTIWIHDYHLMLVPEMLRSQFPEARIGFFLHVPFPGVEIFRTLPFRDRLLEGVLGADLIGFHTAGYARHFAASLSLLLGLAARLDHVMLAEREVRIGVFPMGIDASGWAALAGTPAVREATAALRGTTAALLVGIDRLDYTKGIPRRLLAFEQMLAARPDLAERVRLIQVAVPSRGGVESYREFRNQIERLVGRVNGRFGTVHWVPVQYLHRSLSQDEVAALYRAADVMLVTPVRDGMNLVCKEFVACRADEDGVLVLSEFAGAAAELAEALRVNPFDIDRTAETFARALLLSRDERRERMRALRWRVFSNDVDGWSERFLAALGEAGSHRHTASLAMTPTADIEALIARLRACPGLVLLLDYDGTLVPFAAVPELATPDRPLLELLTRLARRPDTQVHIVSGRLRETLERWMGPLPLWLHAEHGVWWRAAGGDWQSAPLAAQDWRERVRAILEDFRARTPGSLIEEKTAGFAWHYRAADDEFGLLQANELRVHLNELLSNEPVEVLLGDKVIELRPHGVNKGLVVGRLPATPAAHLVLAMGDDRTDEDLFAALPAEGIAVHVGANPSRATVRLADWRAARRLLTRLAEGPDTEVRT